MISTTSPGLVAVLRRRLESLYSELAKFGVVGALAFVVDIVIFNIVLHTTEKPLTSKVASTLVAATVAFFLNRHWSFKHREKTGVRREYGLFFLFNVVGLLIALSCLGLSHYVLGFTSKIADNVAANGVGLVLGTTFRFYSYHRWVWAAPGAVREAAEDGDPAALAVLHHAVPETRPEPHREPLSEA